MDSILLEIPTSPARDPATASIVLAVALLAVVYITFVRPLRQKKKEKDPLQRPSPGAGVSQQRAVEREMSNLLVELSEMARQMTAQLDTRAAKLELLIKEADEKIAVLRAAGCGNALPLSSSRLFPRDDALAHTASAVDGVIAEGRAPIGPSLTEPQLDPRHCQIYDLADEGRSPQEIARQLERPSGEIELILALRGGTDH